MSINDGELAVAAAEAGAAVVLERYGTELARFDKAPGDFATQADLDAEEAVLAVLRSARPDDVVVGEESGRSGAAGGEREWLVDPLCGTLNYAARTMLVSVNVALRTRTAADAGGGRTSAAASADPFAAEVFWTDGDRAWVRRSGRDEPLVPDAASSLVDLNLDPPFPSAPTFRAARLLLDDRFTARFRPRVISSTLAVAWVAAGRRAAYITDGHLADSVHFTAGIALCQAAGCVVTSLDGGPPHTGDEGLLIAADHETHAALLILIRSQW
ncbi:inositol monophosphatase family protein [Paractinoplanes maris]|uniref:inositol monophosphatase family protein n=1 Tax=Paractinoplanes maris TaxID=1734446 RepID=UPI002020C22F|nr:inositol monophosphatase family protein [Actinoplanes maris]